MPMWPASLGEMKVLLLAGGTQDLSHDERVELKGLYSNKGT